MSGYLRLYLINNILSTVSGLSRPLSSVIRLASLKSLLPKVLEAMEPIGTLMYMLATYTAVDISPCGLATTRRRTQFLELSPHSSIGKVLPPHTNFGYENSRLQIGALPCIRPKDPAEKY